MRDNFQHRNNRNNDNDASMIYGTRAVIEALKSGKELERLFVQAGLTLLKNPSLSATQQISSEVEKKISRSVSACFISLIFSETLSRKTVWPFSLRIGILRLRRRCVPDR